MNKMKKWQKTSPKNKDYIVTDEYKDKINESLSLIMHQESCAWIFDAIKMSRQESALTE